MRRAALVIATIVAGCGRSGVDIDIFAPKGVELDRVELWVAYDPCPPTECANGVAWTAGTRVTGDITMLRDESVIVAEPLGDRWVIHLEATTGNADPKWIVVVGFQGTAVKAIKTLRTVHIPANTVEIWQVRLHEAEPATTDLTPPPDPTASVYRAHVWPRQPTETLAQPTGCLAYQKWQPDTHTWQVEYLVPRGDPDCDGHPETLECSPFWFNYRGDGNCVTNDPIIGGACRVGYSPCADGENATRTCGPDKILSADITCLPGMFCEACSTDLPADGCVTAAVTNALAANTLPHFLCTFQAVPDNGCVPRTTVRLPARTSTCTGVLMHHLDRPFTDPAETLSFGALATEIKLQAIRQQLGSAECAVDIQWLGGPQAIIDYTFLLEVAYENGHSILFPVHVHVANPTIACTTDMLVDCEPVGDFGGLLNCGNAP